MIILHTIITADALSCKRQIVYNNTDAISDLGNLTCYFSTQLFSSNALYLHLGDAWFIPRLGQWLVWLTFYGFSQYFQGNAEIVPQLCHGCFLQCVLQLLTNNYTISRQRM
jgi:hypothetical protein